MPVSRNTGQAVTFAILALALALASALLGGVFLLPYGWIPFAAAAAITLSRGRILGGAWIASLRRTGGFRIWALALLLPGTVLVAGYAVAWLAGTARLQLRDTPFAFGGWTVLLVAAMSLGAVGEEMGWRAFLLPRIARYGRVRAGLATGLLWALWHAPVIYVAGTYAAGADGWFMIPFTATIVAMSFIANELRLSSGSVWPAVVFHGAHNGIWFQLQALVAAGSAASLGGESGLVPMTLYGLLAAWIVVRRPAWRFDRQSQPQT